MGVGFVLVVSSEKREEVIRRVLKYYDCYEIGVIKKGEKKIEFINELNWA